MNDQCAGFYLWLAAGAVTFGVGAALAGSGVAHADTEVTRPSHRTAEKPPGHAARVTTVSAAHPRTNVAKALTTKAVTTKAVTARAATTAAATTAMPFPDQLRRGFQQALNGVVPIVNNTPIRLLLDAIDPPSSQPGSTGVRLFGVAEGSVLSPDGSRMFQVTSSGYSGFPARIPPAFHSVTEIDTATNTVVGVPVVVDGAPIGAPVVSSDGRRAYQTSFAIDSATGLTVTYVTTINTADDTILGTPVQISGSPGVNKVVLSPDGSRAYQTTLVWDPSGVATTRLTTIDAAGGVSVGTPLTFQGAPVGGLVASADGSRLYLTTNPRSPDTAVVTVINAADSTIVGQPIVVDGFPNSAVVLGPDGALAAQTTNGTVVTLINTVDATVTATAVVSGVWNASPTAVSVFSDNGARVSQISMVQDPVSQAYTTLLTVIDTGTGAIVGTPLVLASANANQAVVGVPDPAGSRIVVAADVEDPITKTLDSTVITVIDTSDASVIGTPVTVNGYTKEIPVSVGGLRVVQVTQCCVLQYPPTTVISTLDTDGVVIGSSVILNAESLGRIAVSGDGSRAYQTLTLYPTPVTRNYSTLVAAIDTTTGSLVGSPVTVNGSPYSSVLLTPDGGRAFGTTTTQNFFVSLFFPIRVTKLDTTKF